jgi:hypothetical protein
MRVVSGGAHELGERRVRRSAEPSKAWTAAWLRTITRHDVVRISWGLRRQPSRAAPFEAKRPSRTDVIDKQLLKVSKAHGNLQGLSGITAGFHWLYLALHTASAPLSISPAASRRRSCRPQQVARLDAAARRTSSRCPGDKPRAPGSPPKPLTARSRAPAALRLWTGSPPRLRRA